MRRSVVAEQLQNPLGLRVQGLHRSQQRRLLVQRLAGPRDERRRDAERRAVGVFQDVGRAGDVPGRVAAGLEGGADAARGEARGVGLALDQFLAGELGDGVAVAVGGEEAVVLLGGQAGQRIEDVGVVGGPLLDRPVLHGQGHGVGDGRIELFAVLIVFCSALYTDFGSRSFMTPSVNTLDANSSLAGVSLKLSAGPFVDL